MPSTVIAVAVKVAEILVAPVARPFRYLYNYKSYFENLDEEVQKLMGRRDQVQHSVDEAKKQMEEIEQFVNNWLDSVEKMIGEASEFIEHNDQANKLCCKGLPNLKNFQLSKNAERMSKVVARIYEEGNFVRVSYRTIPVQIELLHVRDCEFKSRISTLNDIIDTLRNPDIKIVGVYGMPGIGKTTLVRAVAQHSMENMLFDVVIFVEVSERPNIENIRAVIADCLGLQFHGESESGRRNMLYARLKKEVRVLLILDDVWERIDLEKIGIPDPLGNDLRGCKVLLTARSRDILNLMDSQNSFLVDILNVKESWSLFKKIAGDCVEHCDLQSIAIDLANECGGLPIAIVTIARKLKMKDVFTWKKALDELRRPAPLGGLDDSIVAEAYFSVKLSYEYLKSTELKSMFLLCSMMENASVGDLLKYGTGLDLFQSIRTMEEAHDYVVILVKRLKDSSLLLNTLDNEKLSMHNVVRYAGRLIASTEQGYMWTLTDGFSLRYLVDDYGLKNCTAMFLHDIKELPESLECPQLKVFYLKAGDPCLEVFDNFFIGMQKLRVLHLIGVNLLSMPKSLCLLVDLRTLCMDQCKLQDVAIVGHLEKLQILSFYSSAIEELPREVGQLTKLRLLDLSYCSNLKVIPPNVMSHLNQLEVRCIGNTSIHREVEGLN